MQQCIDQQAMLAAERQAVGQLKAALQQEQARVTQLLAERDRFQGEVSVLGCGKR